MMRFDIFGRYHLLVDRLDGRWVVYRDGLGTRRIDPTVYIPGDIPEEEVGRFLEDLLHEEARPNTGVTRVDPRS